jgi:hypothetical protein
MASTAASTVVRLNIAGVFGCWSLPGSREKKLAEKNIR